MQYDHYYLVTKQHHRRRRQLEKLKTTKRKKYHSKYVYEWHSNKHKKYKRAEWEINIHFEYETKLIFSNTDYEEYEIEEQHEITVEEKEPLNELDNNNSNTNMSLSSCFEEIEIDFYNQQPVNIQFPSAVTSYITSLYDNNNNSDITEHINGLLNSVRYWSIDKQHIHGQATVIGPFLDELMEIFVDDDITMNCSMDVIFLILELVGDAIFWLRKPGLNIFKWSTNSTIRNKNDRNSIMPQTQFKGSYAFRDDEFYFSGYIENEKMRQILNDNPSVGYYQDLDFVFVVFLLLGLVPNTQSAYYRWYFNQKLLSALPGYVPFAALLK